MEREQRVRLVEQIVIETVAPQAAAVDFESRFPAEAFEALRQAGLLSLTVPQELGGPSCSLPELMELTTLLGRACASTAMIWAMHYIQVACLTHHGMSSPFIRVYLSQLTQTQGLIASVTSEVGVGGDIRSSITAIEGAGDKLQLNKEASAISYGAYAESYLITARRNPEAASGDQILALLRREEVSLTQAGSWDTLGMRGTCSPGFRLEGTLAPEQILPVSFGDICSETMTPFSHLLWSAAWLGIAEDATLRARAFLRAKKMKSPQEYSGAHARCAEASSLLQLMRANINDCARVFEELMQRPDKSNAISSFGFAIRINNLKLASSELAVKIVEKTQSICGIAGYKSDSPYSVGRHLRDACSAASMVNNDRLYQTNAALLMAHRGV